MSATIFRDCQLFDGLSGEIQDAMHVVIEGDVIKEVSDRPISFNGAREYALSGKTLMPGLIDAHFHAIAADPDIKKIEQMPKSLLGQYARQMLEAALQRGFTTVRDAGGADYGLAMAVKSGLIKGPRIFYAGLALSQTGGHADFKDFEDPIHQFCLCGQGFGSFGVVADGVDEVRRAARNELRKGATQIKIMASGGVASPTDPIWNLQYSEDEIRAAVWEAHSWRRYVMAHAYTPEAIKRCLEYGVRSIEHANLIDDEAAELAVSKDAFIVPTLATYEALEKYGADLGLPAVSLAKLKDVRAAGLGSLERLKKAGAKIGFGTDLLGAMQEHQSSEFRIRAEVLSAREILLSATSLNAELLQEEGRLGVIAAGALADVLVVDGNPLENLALLEGQGDGLHLIMKGGEIFKDSLT